MATAVQKSSIKHLSNGNGLMHHQNLNGYEHVQVIDQTHHVVQGVEPVVRGDQNEQCLVKGGEISEEQLKIEAESNNDCEQQPNIEEPEIDIVINNVVCSFSVRCHLNLREIALSGANVEYRKENGMVTMKLRRPYTTASIWSSGKITCTGATSEDAAKQAARRFARCLQKLGFNVRFHNYRVVNVLGTCSMPFSIRISSFSQQHREADYEPELHPGVTYKLKNPKATLKIFSTGSVTVTAPSVADVQAAIEYIFPLVYEFRKERTKEEQEFLAKKKLRQFGEPVLEGDDVDDAEVEEDVGVDHEMGESAIPGGAKVGDHQYAAETSSWE